jgi:hypothetical protein
MKAVAVSDFSKMAIREMVEHGNVIARFDTVDIPTQYRGEIELYKYWDGKIRQRIL